MKIIFELGLKEPGRLAFWYFLVRLLRHHSELFPVGMNLAAMGHHFRVIAKLFCAKTGGQD